MHSRHYHYEVNNAPLKNSLKNYIVLEKETITCIKTKDGIRTHDQQQLAFECEYCFSRIFGMILCELKSF